MKPTFILSIALLTATGFAPKVTAQIISNDFVQKGSAQQASKEDELYNQGQTALNENRWNDALDKFEQVLKLKGSRSEGAMYWKAVSLNKLGRAQEALDTINELLRQHRDGRYSKDARALQLEIQGPTGPGPGPGPGSKSGPRGSESDAGCGEDQDLKLLALNQLMNRDEERAIPLLERFLQNAQCKKLRQRALFVLGQSSNPKAHELITRIAKGEIYPELQLRAINEIGVVNANEQNMALLSQIYANPNSGYEVRRAILNTFGVSGDKQRLLQAVRTEKEPKLQRAAINGLGVAGARSELRTLYKELQNYEGKAAVLDAFIVSGDSEAFEEVARTETDPKLQRKAIQGIGISGGRNAGPALVGIYQRSNNADVRRAALEGLFVSDNAKALVDLARAEKDPEMKRRIVEKLSVMDNKEATDYLIEILNK
jgi:HEAT repeat protein